MKKHNLTPKQATFCECYAYTNNMTLALKKALMSQGNGKKWIKKFPQIALYIDLLRQLMILLYIAQYEFCVMLYKLILKRAKLDGDYTLASNIILKISKLRLPMQGNTNANTNEIKIIIGTE